MTKEVDWGNISDGAGGNDGGNSNFRPKVDWLKVPNGGSSRVRLVSLPVEYRRWWEPVSGYSPGFDTDPVVAAGYKPTRSYGIYVIDRNDGSIKVYSCSKKIIMVFKEWSNIKGCAPNDPENGCDWVISKRKQDGKWTYTAMNDEKTPLTEEERKRVAKTVQEAPLTEVFKPDSVERLQELLDEYNANPDGPTPGGWEWWQAKKNAGAAAGGDSSGIKFDDKSDIVDDGDDSYDDRSEGETASNAKFDNLFEKGDSQEQAAGGTSLF